MKMILCMMTMVFLLSGAFTMPMFSQGTLIQGRWNIKTAYSRYPTYGWRSTPEGSFIPIRTNLIRAETNYGLTPWLEGGIHLGLSHKPKPLGNFKQLFPHYGLQTNFHPLGLLIKKDDFRFDLYLNARMRGGFYKSPVKPGTRFVFFEYGYGIGLAFYSWNHTGFFAETGYMKPFKKMYKFETILTSQIGLSIKFKK